MKNTITCSVKEAKEHMKHLNDDDMVTLTLVNQKTRIFGEPIRIYKTESENLIDKARCIEYQDNGFFGRFSLYGATRDKNIIQNILFPQLE